MNTTNSFTLRTGGYSIRLHMASLVTLAALAVLLLATVMLALLSGSETMPLRTILGYFHVVSLPASDANTTQLLILDAFRAPRICLALICGAMLASAGAVMQSMTRNGLADPSILGVKEGAALCVVALMLTMPSVPLVWRPLIGMVGGLASGALVLFLARGSATMRFVMIGICVSWFLSAIMMIVLAASDTKDMQTAMIWLAGSLHSANWQGVEMAGVLFAVCISVLLFTSPAADIETLGDGLATSLGVQRKRIRVIRFGLAILLVAGSVSVVGSIGFVGLIAPHVARFLPNKSGRYHLISTSFIGAILVLAADTLGRSAFAPVELPTGVVIAVIGAPTLIILLWKRRNQL